MVPSGLEVPLKPEAVGVVLGRATLHENHTTNEPRGGQLR